MNNKYNSKSYFIYGKHSCLAALQNPQRRILKVFCSPQIFDDNLFNKHISKINFKITSKQELDQLLANNSAHQGIAIQVLPISNKELSKEILEPNQTIAIADQITDPQNLGAIIRSAAAFNVKNIIIPQDHCAKENANLAKIASGALEFVNIIEVVNISQTINKLKQAGFWIIGLDHNSNNTIGGYRPAEKVALVLGSESDGIRPLIKKHCDLLLKIPMQHSTLLDSLNTSAASTIAFYEMFKQRS